MAFIKINDKRGIAVFVAMMLGVIFFILGIALAPSVRSIVDDSLTQLNCTTDYLTNSSITNQTRAICTQLDFFVPLLTGLLFGFAGVLIAVVIR